MSRHQSTCEASVPTQSVGRDGSPTVADVLRRAVDKGHLDPRALTRARAKVLYAILLCRTAALGGHAVVCPDCGETRVFHNSCRNRHCPQCQWSAQEKWIKARLERLLDTHYFHVVFTLPAELRPLALANQRQLYALLFSAASQTLIELGRDPRRLGANIGVTAVLHTWARNLTFHPHVHCLVTGGGLCLDGKRWKSTRRRYLFPAAVMSALFRGKFLAGLKALHDKDGLVGVDDDFPQLLNRLYEKKWLVYAKTPMAGPQQVLSYLGRYTHRVAISNSRILRLTDDHVTFVTRDRKTETLSLGEFGRRFLLHVLPSRFVKIRHYGLFAAANSKTKWATARELRPVRVPDDATATTEADCAAPSCSSCGSTHLLRIVLSRHEVLLVTIDGFQIVDSRGPPVHRQPGRTH